MSVPAPPPPSPPAISVVSFAATSATCGRSPLPLLGLVQPFAIALTQYGRDQPAPTVRTYRFSFSINSNGRSRDIRQDHSEPAPGPFVNTSDLAPSLAASHFRAGAVQTGCAITYTATPAPLEDAPLPALYEIASRPEPVEAPSELRDRIAPPDADCRHGPGQYRQLNLPAFEKIAQPAGAFAWVYFAYDVRPDGRVVRLRKLGSSGDAVLDRAATRALLHNRYAAGPGYRGCTYRFHRVGEQDDARPELPEGTPADTGDLPACRIDPKTMQSLLNGSAYPAPYALRKVKGIAAVSYDTAPWGAIGNIKVIASEPGEAFGEAARGGMFAAKVAESDVGHRGCVRRVRFRLPRGG